MSKPLSLSSTGPSRPLSNNWEELRKEARKLEGDIDVKLASYSKLGSTFASSSALEGTADTPELVAATKAAEIEALLRRLGDVNEAMTACISSGASDVSTHTLARHRDILHEFTLEFKRTRSTVQATREHAELLAGFDRSESGLMGFNNNNGATALLRERGTIHNANSAMDEVINIAESTTASLQQQRTIFLDINSRLNVLGAKFPVVNNLLTAIRRKKSRDNLILSGVITACTLFLIIYWLSK